MHANIVLSHDLLDYSPLFVEIADAYFDMEMYKEASALYELLGEDTAVGLVDSFTITSLSVMFADQ